MQRLLSVVALSIVVPAAAAAQVVPPVPPSPPARPAQPPPPVPPVPPAVRDVMAPGYFDRLALEEGLRAARLLLPDFQVHLDDLRWDASHPFEHAFAGQQTTAESSAYNSGLQAFQNRQYERAITYFDRVISQKGLRTDGALHWKAFAQYRLGKWDDALTTLGVLRKDHPQSRYLADAKALEADVRRRSGQSLTPEQIANLDDDELKLLAIQGIQRTDPERAVQLAEGLLNAANSLKVKRQALYLLAMSDQPRARQVLLGYAKGGGNPDLQRAAIGYLASSRQKTTSADLQEIYNSTQDLDIRRAIIQGFVTAGDKPALYRLAGADAPPEIRAYALSGLSSGSLASPQDLWALYQKETSKELRLQMVRAFGSMGAVEQLTQVLKIEKDPEVRREAMRRLGGQRVELTGQALVTLYEVETDRENRRAIISALSSQNNADGLVAIARKETSLELKTEIVRRLSDMAPRSKVAADYLMEIIK
jgi:hypothetical protein